MKTIIAIIVGLGLMLTGVTGCKKQNDSQSSPGEPKLFSQSFKVEPRAFTSNLRKIDPPKPGEPDRALLIRFFSENGVSMETPADVIIDEIGKRVLVRAPETQKEKVQALFDRIEKGQ